jgi:hypothetical protein
MKITISALFEGRPIEIGVEHTPRGTTLFLLGSELKLDAESATRLSEALSEDPSVHVSLREELITLETENTRLRTMLSVASGKRTPQDV